MRVTVDSGMSLAGKTCTNCNNRPATCWFQVGSLDVFHGGGRPWCDKCKLEAQLKHARESAAEIPHLEAELAKLQ